MTLTVNDLPELWRKSPDRVIGAIAGLPFEWRRIIQYRSGMYGTDFTYAEHQSLTTSETAKVVCRGAFSVWQDEQEAMECLSKLL
jgi:hypothetical protein